MFLFIDNQKHITVINKTAYTSKSLMFVEISKTSRGSL